jgi:hypothetical protein
MAHHTLFKLNSCRIALCILVIALVLLVNHGTGISRAESHALGSASSNSSVLLTGAPETSNSVMYQTDGAAGCRNSTPEESVAIARRDVTRELRSITPPGLQSASGLQIILRATPELDADPQAKAAFLRAADVWASRVESPTTVIIDVDFGPAWFGQEFPEGVIGATNPQMLVASGHYFTVLGRLIGSTTDSKELSLYWGLPLTPTVPTDLGDTASVLAPSAVYRTLGLINSDPTLDPPFYGPSPAIGFNSAMNFDFDASDGIDSGKYDFEAVVAHEIGHVLGFVSAVGQREINPNCELAVTVWDLFRLRPGVSMGGLATSDRILSSGGAQVFFEGDSELQLSTGRPDGTGGDGLQPSHWRDDSIVGQRIGIMDPTIPAGAHQTITFNDLAALDLFGYTLKPFGNNRPAISTLAADLNGDVLTLTGAAADADGDVVQVEAQFLDQKGHAIAQTAPFTADFGITTTLALRLRFTGMSGLAEATQISVVLIDSHGNRSGAVSADFSGGDPGAVKLADASYDGTRLLIKGKRLTGDAQIEINGVIVAPPASVSVSANGKKLTITAPSAALNLRAGSNRIRVISGGLRSSLLVAAM